METKTEAASFAATNLEPDAVITGIPNADHVWQYGTRWETAEGHTTEWWDSEKFARAFTSSARGDASLVRRMVITGPAEVIA